MNLPNQITLARLVLTALFVMILAAEVRWAWSWGAILFIVASITDYLDGYFARKHGLVTHFGSLMDPLVDKILTCSAFVMLSSHDEIPTWVTCLVVAREFLVTGMRLVAESQGFALSVDSWGKWKTGAQIAVVIYGLLRLAVSEPPFAWFAPFYRVPAFSPAILGRLLLWLAVITTVWSGLRYLLNNRQVLRDA
jgi:CDP-diacylglycerol--glycerol-3-phosphate 3-phosphatidyltransferase